MATQEQIAIIKAKPEADRSAEDKAAIVEFDAQTAAALKKAEQEHMIPKSRLDEVISIRDELKAKLDAAEKVNRESEEKRLKEQNDWKALYEKAQNDLAELKPKADIAEESEKTLRSVLKTEIESLPEHLRKMVPSDLSVQKQLNWLSENKPLLLKAKPFDIGAGRQGGGAPETADLTPEEIRVAQSFGMTPEDYAKNK